MIPKKYLDDLVEDIEREKDKTKKEKLLLHMVNMLHRLYYKERKNEIIDYLEKYNKLKIKHEYGK